MTKSMTKFATLLLFSAVSAAPLAAQQNPSPAPAASLADATPSAEQILDRHVEAIGGKAAVEKVTSRVSRGTAEIVGVETKGTIEVYEKAPNKLIHIVHIPGVIASSSGFNGKVAWAFNADSGKVEEKKGAELEAVKVESDFYQVLKLKERYPRVTLKGVKKIQYRDGERETYVVDATPVKGGAEKLFFDTESGLLIRRDTQEESDGVKVQVREFFLDYKDVDGVKVPFTTRQAEGEAVFVFRFTEVKHNVAIDDGRFNKPAIK